MVYVTTSILLPSCIVSGFPFRVSAHKSGTLSQRPFFERNLVGQATVPNFPTKSSSSLYLLAMALLITASFVTGGSKAFKNISGVRRGGGHWAIAPLTDANYF